MICPFGGECIDPGNPSDCEVNCRCVCFTSREEKEEFDSLPDIFAVEIDGSQVYIAKNQNQVDFFIQDLSENLKEKLRVSILW